MAFALFDSSTISDLFISVLNILDIAQLRKKFEEDKEKVAKMKAARKFRPY